TLPPPGTAIPLAAFKGLTRMALSLLPARELDHFPDAIEWVCNPDHALDGRSFEGPGCLVHAAPDISRAPWAALARRVDDDSPSPYMLFPLGTSGLTFESPVPLCIKDEALDDAAQPLPRVASVDGLERGAGEGPCVALPASAAP